MLTCGFACILTRTEITAGFTFSTMSANPIGPGTRCASAERFWAYAAGTPCLKSKLGAKNVAAPRPAMVVARRATRRAEKVLRGFEEGVLSAVISRLLGGSAMKLAD